MSPLQHCSFSSLKPAMNLVRFDEHQWRSWGGFKKSLFIVLALCLSSNVPRIYDVRRSRMCRRPCPQGAAYIRCYRLYRTFTVTSFLKSPRPCRSTGRAEAVYIRFQLVLYTNPRRLSNASIMDKFASATSLKSRPLPLIPLFLK